MTKRLPAARFSMPSAQLRDGFLADQYFNRSREILQRDRHDPIVTVQVFCRAHSVLCGVDEAIAALQVGAAAALEIHALADGDDIAPWETVMTIRGAYSAFAHLETVYLGVLARGTRVATQARALVEAAGGTPVLFFGARHDHFATQCSDGHAALTGGVSAVATDAQGALHALSGVGTVPHALIAAYGGDTVLASRKFVEFMPADIPFVALVDFDNDCVGTSLAVARALGPRLSGVRLDTSSGLVDKSLQGSPHARPGVTPELVENVRRALDAENFASVQIVVSGGINVQRIGEFVDARAPVDAFGVGSAIVRNNGEFDFTADVVEVMGEPISKHGRLVRPNPRLAAVAWGGV